MASKSIYGQFKDIEKEVQQMANDIAKELSKEVVKDLKDVYKQIMDDFYDSYRPDRYVRTKNLYRNAIIEQHPIPVWNSYDSGIVVGSFNMFDNYNISPDNVFDLMWNKGVRGLPKVGTRTLEDGGTWRNPTWKSQYGERENVFRTSVTLGGYTAQGTPAQVMANITNHWKEAGGEVTCDRIAKEIKNKYK